MKQLKYQTTQLRKRQEANIFWGRKRIEHFLETSLVYPSNGTNVQDGCPDSHEPIRWKLVTNLPVSCKADAVEKLDWYALRRKIEMFHKVMKSGCRAEDSRLRTVARLANLIAMMCIVAWRVLWLTILNRTDPKLPATLALTEVEILVLDRLMPPADDSNRRTVGDVLNRLGGYLNRHRDGPPGHTVLWRGMTRLADIQLGYDLDHSCG